MKKEKLKLIKKMGGPPPKPIISQALAEDLEEQSKRQKTETIATAVNEVIG